MSPRIVSIYYINHCNTSSLQTFAADFNFALLTPQHHYAIKLQHFLIFIEAPLPYCVLRLAFQQQLFSHLKGKAPAVTFLVQVWLQVQYGNCKPQRAINAEAGFLHQCYWVLIFHLIPGQHGSCQLKVMLWGVILFSACTHFLCLTGCDIQLQPVYCYGSLNHSLFI